MHSGLKGRFVNLSCKSALISTPWELQSWVTMRIPLQFLNLTLQIPAHFLNSLQSPRQRWKPFIMETLQCWTWAGDLFCSKSLFHYAAVLYSAFSSAAPRKVSDEFWEMGKLACIHFGPKETKNCLDFLFGCLLNFLSKLLLHVANLASA